MTDKPSDAEIVELMRDGNICRYNDVADHVEFARAVLAKWGTPAVAGEPFCWHWENTFNGGMGVVKKNPETLGINMTHPDHKWTALYTAPQPTQTQPVAREPLTDEQIQDLLLCGNPTDEEMRLIRIGWDAAHGIKGGQHGTE